MDRYPDGMERMRERLRLVERAIAATATPPRTAQHGEPLTERETDVLRLLQGSLSLSEIAGELFISPNTVKTHAKARVPEARRQLSNRGRPDRPTPVTGLARSHGRRAAPAGQSAH